jgi:type IV secretory pathway VirJ component
MRAAAGGRTRRALVLAVLATVAWAAFGGPAAALAAKGALAATAAKAPAAAAVPAVEHQTYGRFGQVTIFRRSAKPTGVVVLLSDDGGWDARAEQLAHSLQSMDALVIGLDLAYYLRKAERMTQDCLYPAGDFEMLSKLVQKKLDLPTYTPPVLAGVGTGATLAYGALAQAPSGTFAGAVSLGFCPRFEASHPLCTGRGVTSKALPGGAGFQLEPVAKLDQPWLLSPAAPAEGTGSGGAAERCDGPAAEAFVAKVGNAAVVAPAKGHGKHAADTELRAESGLKQAYLRVLNTADLARAPETPVRKPLADLPLLELPVPGSTGETLAILISGDGGWAGLDRDVATHLSTHGIPVVGLNTLQYFWTPRTPEGAAADLARIIRAYLPAWGRKDVALIGYSLGAEVLPFMTNRLPPDVLQKVKLVALLGPSRTTSFEFHLSEWLGHGGGENRPVLPEVRKLKGKPLICIFGTGEKASSLCSVLGTAGTPVELPGSHNLGANPRPVVNILVRQITNPSQAPSAAPLAGSKAASAAGGAGAAAAGGTAGGAAGTASAGAAAGAGAGAATTSGGAGAGGVAGAAGAAGAAGSATPPPAPATPKPPPVSLSMSSLTGVGEADLGMRLGVGVGLGFALAREAAKPAAAGTAAAAGDDSFQYGRFGQVHLVRRTQHPSGIVLFFSGEGGWDATAAAMATTIAGSRMLAVGIDTRAYLDHMVAHHDKCAYTAGSLENLSKAVQKRLGFPAYQHPLVAGYGAGAALAYGALAQAPPNTFRGALSLGFCADVPAPGLCADHALTQKPAAGGKGPWLLPARGVEQPWIALQGGADTQCPAAGAAEFADGTAAAGDASAAGGKVETLPGVDHAFAKPELWQPALRKAVERLNALRPAAAGEVWGSKALPGLPVIEMQAGGAGGAAGAAAGPGGGNAGGAAGTGGGAGGAGAAEGRGPLTVMLSGDGGWTGVDRGVAQVLAGQRGAPVVGLDTLAYFWNGRTLDAAAADLARLLRHYRQAWKRDQVVLAGYSFGADVLPFLVSRLPASELAHVRLIALLGPSPTTPFEIRVREDKKSEQALLPELRKLGGRPLLCVAAKGEEDSLCPQVGPDLGQTLELDGSHAFRGDYATLADRILQGARDGKAGAAGGRPAPPRS